MNQGDIIRSLLYGNNKTLRITILNSEQLKPVGMACNATWIIQLTNNPNKLLKQLKEEFGSCSFQASWWTHSIRHSVESAVEIAKSAFEGKSLYNIEIIDAELDCNDLIFIAMFIKYTYYPSFNSN